MLPLQTPAPQTSPVVQPFLSSQAAVLFVKTQPLLGSHASLVQGLPSLHPMRPPATQLPALHWSPAVHRLPSLQLARFALLTQPWPGKQASSVQTLPSSQLWMPLAMHLPPLHASPVVQLLPSSHTAALLAC